MARKSIAQPTSPGDQIEFGLTVEVTTKRGAKVWAKAGLVSEHRPGETTQQAVDRIEGFVVESVNDLQDYFTGKQ